MKFHVYKQPYPTKHWKEWSLFTISIDLVKFSQTYQTFLHIYLLVDILKMIKKKN